VTTETVQRGSAWAPLRRPVFRAIWGSLLGSQVVIWMHNVGAVTVVASLSDSPTLIAAVQTATSLPAVLLSLLAGATADIVDRRRLVLAAQAWMVAATSTLAVLTFTDTVTAGLALALTLALGAGMAPTILAYQAMTPDAIGEEELPEAVALNSVAINIARAIGPALAGLLIVALSAGALFAIESAVVLLIMLVVFRLRIPSERPDSPEPLFEALRAGARYVRFFGPARTTLIRAGLFAGCASALWALLPVVAVGPLDLDSRGLGLLMGCVGTGALCGAVVMPRLRARLGFDLMIALASLALAAGLSVLAWVDETPIVAVALLFTGASWLTVLSSLNTAAQWAAAGWVRARTLASFQFVMQGSLAFGSLAWGLTAGAAGVRTALMIAAAGLLLGVVAGRHWPLSPGTDVDVSPAAHWATPELGLEPRPADGPVLVTLEYRVRPERTDEFVAAMTELGRIRRRDGAYAWDLYEDLEDPGRFLETFTVGSWQEHLRQHERGTVADLDVEQRVKEMHEGPEPPLARHLLSAWAAQRAREQERDGPPR
jgi:MFS family permease/quinol monooxygenase YgiN